MRAVSVFPIANRNGVAISGANDCLYCIAAHGAILRVYAKDPLVADQVAVNYRKADISDRQKAMLAFALKVALRSVEIVETDFEVLRGHLTPSP